MKYINQNKALLSHNNIINLILKVKLKKGNTRMHALLILFCEHKKVILWIHNLSNAYMKNNM